MAGAIGFGDNDAAIEQERIRQLEADKKKQEVAKSLGFPDETSLQDARKFAQLDPGLREKFFAELEKKRAIELLESFTQ